MRGLSRHQYREGVRSFIDLDKFTNPHSVTLTLKQSYVTYHRHLMVHNRITHDRAVGNFRHFMNLLNRNVYGQSFKRHGKRVQVIPVLEGGGQDRFHYHCVIDCPKAELIDDYPFLIEGCWSATDYGYHQIDVQSNSDDGWVSYITKYRTKTEFDQSIDWINLHQN